MSKLNANKVINGTHGMVVLDGEEFSNLKSFQARIEFEKEDIKLVGKMATQSKIMGYKGTGSVALHKVDSRMLKLLGEKIRRGSTPVFTIIASLADPDSIGAERVAIEGVTFDDLTIFDFEVGALGQQECPFTFTDWTVLDEI